MLLLYVVALGFGGTLLGASLLFGGDHDKDFDADVDADVDADADADGDHDHASEAAISGGAFDAIMVWLPLLSLRFWTFFFAFFGLTGATLTVFDLAPNTAMTGAISGIVGYLSGMSVVLAMRRLRRNQPDSNIRESDYIGETALVMVAIGKGTPGKVRLHLKGRTVDLMAETEEEAGFGLEQSVMVYGIKENGSVIVTRPEEASR
jgi:membrane protein implicated in regulation of membrane protease activity